jgi:hypothetical protein
VTVWGQKYCDTDSLKWIGNYANYYLKSEVLKVAKCPIAVFWVVMLCSLVGGYQHFQYPISGLNPAGGHDTFFWNGCCTLYTSDS